MTRFEEIQEVAKKQCGMEYDFNDNLVESDKAIGFILGAKWADKHPKSSWISIKDKLPKEDDDILVFAIYEGKTMYAWWKGIYLLEEIKTGECDFNFWMPIPKFEME